MDRLNAIACAKMLMVDIAKGHPMYVIVRSVTQNGMSKTLDFHMPFVDLNGRMYTLWMTPHIAQVLDKTMTKDEYVTIRGCGIDAPGVTVAQFCEAVFGDPEYLTCDVL